MILARYSGKDIHRLSSKHMSHDAVTAAYTLICLSDWRRWRPKFTGHSTPYAPFTAKRYTRLYQVLSCGWWDTAGVCGRLWLMPKLPNHARLDGGTAKDWKRDDVCSLRPFLVIRLILMFTLQMASALEDLSGADASSKTIPTVIR